ncbi:hypothetical protein [Streptomyces sp. NPDC047841]|uniref:hypothetical protein n=1 Tax=Streptomyces sp. NPDC047841 TaxID=3154708 RepID=UPI0034572B8B
MAVSDLTAARRRTRPSAARLLLIGLYCTAAVTGVVLGSWPHWLLAPVLLTAAGCRAVLPRHRAGRACGPGRAQGAPGTPSGEGSRP